MSSYGHVPDSGIGEILVSSRSLAEYRAMFALEEDDLVQRILDCPGGTSSFTAEINDLGGQATACDVVYQTADLDDLAARSLAETERGNRYVRGHLAQYRWGFFADPDEHLRSRRGAGLRFAADYRNNPNRYVPGRLPELPFADSTFELVLSSHLLFSYADRLSLDDHRVMLLELMRVARAEVRVFPLVAMGAVPYPHLNQLLDELANHGFVARVVEVDYEFQAGGNQMLVCQPSRR